MLDLFFKPNRVYHLGPIAFTIKTINDIEAGRAFFSTSWRGVHRDAAGNLKGRHDWGAGKTTIDFVNQLVSQAVTGTSVVPYLSATKYLAYGTTGTPAPADTDTTPVSNGEGSQARSTLTLTNFQTATGSNHAAILQYANASPVTITAAATYTEFWIVDTASGAVNHLLDHRSLGTSVNALVGDTLSVTYQLTLNSNN